MQPSISPSGIDSNPSLRFAFNGKENDNEVNGVGNFQDYGMRNYDNRLCRFLRVDPATKKYPELTPFQFANNSPIAGIDLDGLELAVVVKQLYSSSMSNQQVYSFDLADERRVYEDVVKSFCNINNIDPSSLPSDRILSIEYDYTNLQNGEPTLSYAWSAKETEITYDTRTPKEKFIAAINTKENSYYGIGGLNNALKDVNEVAIPVLKTVGLLQMACGNIPGGVATLEATEYVSNMVDGYDIGRDIKNGNKTNIILTVGAKAATKVADVKLDKSSLNEISKSAAKTGSDFIIDKAKDNLSTDR